ncbi:MAG: FG-GAP-like repeat-containing protein [Fibrobacterota bacterium]|nr:FG-GAP-like repeat-containing protein [Fibrobacterota bacterium]
MDFGRFSSFVNRRGGLSLAGTLMALLAFTLPAGAQEFRQTDLGLPPITSWFGAPARVSFADFDKDGDLDAMLLGVESLGGVQNVKVYRNENGKYRPFENFKANSASESGAAAWADLDGDGYFELITYKKSYVMDPIFSGDTGEVSTYGYDPAKGAFAPKELGIEISGILSNAVFEFADYDKDGKPDLLVAGSWRVDRKTTPVPYTRILHNDGGNIWSDATGEVVPTQFPIPVMKDIDGDQDLDLFLAGSSATSTSRGRFYVNNAGVFQKIDSITFTFDVKSADLGDYNGDKLADLVVNGGYPANTQTYKRNGARFTLDNNPLGGTAKADVGSVNFGDVDDDGDLDLVVTGEFAPNALSHFSRIYQNEGGYFYNLDAALPPFWNSVAFFVDFDKDGNQDLFLAGTTTNDQGQVSNKSIFMRNVRGDFIQAAPALDSLSGSRARMGDYDNDGDLDIVACGAADINLTTKRGCRLLRNDGAGGMARVVSVLDSHFGDPEWGDFDGDGRLDVLLAGNYGTAGRLKLFRNAGADFEEVPIKATLPEEPGVFSKMRARWGDFDGDGRLDILAWGAYYPPASSSPDCFSRILHNDGGQAFTTVSGTPMPGLCDGEMEWGDFDRDGDLDVLFAGDTLGGGNNKAYTAVYRNDERTLVRTDDKFLGLSFAHAAWGDFDRDGDLDIAIGGSDLRSSENLPTTLVYRLVGGRFEQFWKSPNGLIGDVAWFDFDNDGDLDLLNSGRYFSGLPPNVNITLLWRNVDLKFSYVMPPDPYIKGELDAGDLDGDGDLDFVVSGRTQVPNTVGDGWTVTRIYRNTLVTPNAAPASPSGARSVLGLGSATLSWNSASDPETQPASLSYNLRIGTAPGLADVLAPHASADGRRLLPGTGNTGHATTRLLSGLTPGAYFWSVQTVDKQEAGSAFASEQSFTIGLPAPRLLSATPGPGSGKVTLRWESLPQPHFRKYFVHYGQSAGPTENRDSLASALDTVYTVEGLENDKTWQFRISASDQGINPSPYSVELQAIPDGTPPPMPDPVILEAGDRSIRVSWPECPSPDFLAYLVYQRNASGPVVRIDSITDVKATRKTISGLKNGTPYSFLLVAVDKVENRSGFSPEAVGIPFYLVSPAAAGLDFGRIPLASSRTLDLSIANLGPLAVPVDSIRFVNSAFSLAVPLTAFPPLASVPVSVRFLPTRPAGGDFAGTMRIHYGGSQAPLEIDLAGAATAAPYCRIDRLIPSDAIWDTATAVSFLASANDSDNAGEGDRIVAYLWSSDRKGPLAANASGFSLGTDGLGIGTHRISLRVVDNEGDTSAEATATLVVRGRKPLVRIETISPVGLIIRGADRPRFVSAAYDRDEGASPASPDLADFAVFSTLQGRIGTATDFTLQATDLAIGLHGFFARAVDDEGDTAYSDTGWIPVQAGLGQALVVAGTDFNDNRYFYENIAPNCNWVYSKLRQRGFTDSLITYMNPVGWQSIGGDYHKNSNIVDETEMTVANLRERILGYRERVQKGVPLILSLIGHGGRADKQNGKFYLSPTEFVSADSLDAWLDAFDTGSDGNPIGYNPTPIVLILDFCFSGSFFPALRSSTQNRIVIASSGVDKQAYFQSGRSFSYAFFKQIEKGGNLTQAWAAARQWSDANTQVGLERANPLANADNDNSPNESEDFDQMGQVYIGGSQQDQSPDVQWKDVQLTYESGLGSMRIRALPEQGFALDSAWFTLIAPNFSNPAPGAAVPFFSAGLTKQSDGSFAGRAELFPVLEGDYLFIVYGIKDGDEIMPVTKRANPSIPVGVTLRPGSPLSFGLGQNFPNPSTLFTYFPFAVTQRGPVRLDLFAMDGHLVKRLVAGVMAPGNYLMQWDGKDEKGREMATGVYTYRLHSAEGVLRKKLVRGR